MLDSYETQDHQDGQPLSTPVARLTCDALTARRLATLVDDSFGDDVVVAAFENDGGDWTIEVTFGAPVDEAALRALIKNDGGEATALTFSNVVERDWVAASLTDLTPVHAGRFIVHGAHHRGQIPPNAIGIEIEAALAFGTGHHGTTRGCLLALDRLIKRRKPWARHPEVRAKRASKDDSRPSFEDRLSLSSGRASRGPVGRPPQDDGSRSGAHILDVGTGTGVLAIAAAKALRCKVAATDIDPVAVATAKANARHNRAAAFVRIRPADACRALPYRGPFDLIFANILLAPLVRMAKPLAQRLAPGGRIVLSGLMPDQANAALAAYRAQGLALDRRTTLENWVTLVMRRGRKRNRPGGGGRGGLLRQSKAR